MTLVVRAVSFCAVLTACLRAWFALSCVYGVVSLAEDEKQDFKTRLSYRPDLHFNRGVQRRF